MSSVIRLAGQDTASRLSADPLAYAAAQADPDQPEALLASAAAPAMRRAHDAAIDTSTKTGDAAASGGTMPAGSAAVSVAAAGVIAATSPSATTAVISGGLAGGVAAARLPRMSAVATTGRVGSGVTKAVSTLAAVATPTATTTTAAVHVAALAGAAQPTAAATAAYSVVVDVSAKFINNDVPSFTLKVDGVAVSGAIPVNTATTEPIGFSLNLTSGVAHAIQIVSAAPDSAGQLLTVQDIRFQGTTISATNKTIETYASSHGTVAGTGSMSYGGTVAFNLAASYFGGTATQEPTPTPTPVPTPTPTPVPTPTPTPTPVSAGAIIVGGGSQYTTIQQGIAAAEKTGSHSLVVMAGHYAENDTIGAADNGLAITADGSVTLTGSIAISSASHVSVAGLGFQGNGSNVAVNTLNSTALTVTDDSFSGTGQAVVLDGTTNSTVSNNLMTSTAASAIELRDGANGNTLTSNEITGDTAQNTIGAIWLHGANNTAITHNQITNTTGAAISLSDFYGPGTTATQNNNDTVADNSLSQVDTQSSDAGAIYILGRSQDPSTGDVVKMNFIGATGSSGAHAVGIYLDDNASGVSVTQNIVQATASLSDSFEIHGGSNNTISGNIFDLGKGSPSYGLLQQDESNEAPQGSFSQLTNDTISGNVYASESTAPRKPGFANITGGIGHVTISGNDYWSFAGAALDVAGSGASGDTAAHYVRPAAAAATTLASYGSWSGDGIGFQAINTSSIGLAPSGAHAY